MGHRVVVYDALEFGDCSSLATRSMYTWHEILVISPGVPRGMATPDSVRLSTLNKEGALA